MYDLTIKKSNRYLAGYYTAAIDLPLEGLIDSLLITHRFPGVQILPTQKAIASTSNSHACTCKLQEFTQNSHIFIIIVLLL